MELNLLKVPINKNNQVIDQFELHNNEGMLLAVAVPTDLKNEYRILEELSKEPRYSIILSNSLLNMGKTIKTE